MLSDSPDFGQCYAWDVGEPDRKGKGGQRVTRELSVIRFSGFSPFPLVLLC